MFRFMIAASIACATAASAREVVIPVITGTVPGRIFATTVQVKNASETDAQCTFLYAGPERVGKPLRSEETIPAGQTRVYEDFLSEIAAAGTVRVTCSAAVEIVTRVQDSTDGGKTFTTGRVYRPFPIENLIAQGGTRTIRTRADLLLAEMTGNVVHVEVIAKNLGGVPFGTKSYDIPPHAQRVVNLSTMRDKLPEMDVTVTVTSGAGKILIGKESRDPAIVRAALRRPAAQRVVQVVANAAASPAITEQLLLCPFKAAPFRDPATGLCFMRDRWYDPSTGTFLTPDRAGYRDSSNLYIFGKGDPVNNSDPTGMYIDETAILNSPLRDRYTAWRDDFRSSQLGREAWDRIHALPPSRFTLRMLPLAVGRGDTTGAVATREYDAAGTYIGGSIAFAPSFGSSAPDVNNPRARLEYPRAFDVESTVIFSRRRYKVYSFGHEFGHILSGFDPAQAADAHQIVLYQAQQTQVSQQIQQLRQKQLTVGLTPTEQHQYNQLLAQYQQLQRTVDPFKLAAEQYGDAIGYQFFRSWNLQHHRIFERPNPSPPPALPPGALPPP